MPTLDASGLKGYDLVTWFGFGAPAGTPPEIVQRLRDEFARVAADPAVKAKFREAGLDPIDQMQPLEFARLIASDLAKWTPIIKAADARAESGRRTTTSVRLARGPLCAWSRCILRH